MTTYFSSDQHFGHRRIVELSGRPFSSVEEMNETLVENWNATVTPDGTTWILGDVVMGHLDTSLQLCGRLNGTKILVGHDELSPLPHGQRLRCMSG